VRPPAIRLAGPANPALAAVTSDFETQVLPDWLQKSSRLGIHYEPVRISTYTRDTALAIFGRDPASFNQMIFDKKFLDKSIKYFWHKT
jgi:hypothetical protein